MFIHWHLSGLFCLDQFKCTSKLSAISKLLLNIAQHFALFDLLHIVNTMRITNIPNRSRIGHTHTQDITTHIVCGYGEHCYFHSSHRDARVLSSLFSKQFPPNDLLLNWIIVGIRWRALHRIRAILIRGGNYDWFSFKFPNGNHNARDGTVFGITQNLFSYWCGVRAKPGVFFLSLENTYFFNYAHRMFM